MEVVPSPKSHELLKLPVPLLLLVNVTAVLACGGCGEYVKDDVGLPLTVMVKLVLSALLQVAVSVTINLIV